MSAIMLSAKEAAAELGVRVDTLYAYVSRGLIHSEPGPGRARLYSAKDVRAFRQKERRNLGGDQTNESLVIHSAITAISDEGPSYRGRLATELAGNAGFESVATLLWQCEGLDPFSELAPDKPLENLPASLRGIERAMVMVAAWPLGDKSAYSLNKKILWRHGAALCRVVTAELVGTRPDDLPLVEHMARAWNITNAGHKKLIAAALVLSADHELNSSAFAVRVAASTGAPLHAALASGFGAFLGPRHGAASERADYWLGQFPDQGSITKTLEEQLMLAQDLPGFGHLVYIGADPRAVCLLNLLHDEFADHPFVRMSVQICEEALRLFGLFPNIDFALAVVRRVLELPAQAGMSLFCAGRMAGWIAHALEQYETTDQIRPRAVYTGPRAI